MTEKRDRETGTHQRDSKSKRGLEAERERMKGKTEGERRAMEKEAHPLSLALFCPMWPAGDRDAFLLGARRV